MSGKVRVNITVDRDKLERAKTKLHLFGGKLSTLFNAYLDDFVKSIDQSPTEEHKELIRKMKEIESRVLKLESKK
ncbi:hypothetical protein FJZ18_00625 [Candidatus Pacearchaeota archaeon]|nr:hypothetical protein [Candidatus Pacearchaeota archaeon]